MNKKTDRRAAFAFVFVTVMLDMLAIGVIIPVLPWVPATTAIQFSRT